MIRRTHRRIAFAMLAVIAAAGLAMPSAALGCEATRLSHCCCQTGDTQHAPSTDCVSRHCPCCQPAVPENLPPERVVPPIHPEVAVVSGLIARTIDSPVRSDSIEASPADDFVDVPHRILHCSWLI